jgi:hypothetical protein
MQPARHIQSAWLEGLDLDELRDDEALIRYAPGNRERT